MMTGKLRILIFALAAAFIAVILALQLNGGSFRSAASDGLGQSQTAPTTLPVVEQVEPKGGASQKLNVAAPAQVSSDGPGFGTVFGIAAFLSLLAALAGGVLGRRLVQREIAELHNEINKVKRNVYAEQSKRADYDQFGAQSDASRPSTRHAGRAPYAHIPPSIPRNPDYRDSNPVADWSSAEPTLPSQPATYPAQQPSVLPIDPVEEQRKRDLLRESQADQAVADFHAHIQQFLAGAGVSQKAFDAFVGQFGQTWLVQGIDGGYVQRASDVTGTEKLLALQLAGTDRVILLPSFYFISDFSSSFAKIGDVPRDIRAAFEIVGAGNGQLRINRLGLLQRHGDKFALSEPRGELGGFID